MDKAAKVGVAIVGGGAVLWALSRLGKAAPPDLVQGYLRDIAASNTLEALAAVRTRFEADRATGALTEAKFQQVYDAYAQRYGELSGSTAILDLRAVKPSAYMPDPLVYVDGEPVGNAPVIWNTNPGTYVVSWEDRPGGDNPAPGIAYFQAPAPQTVTVVAGQTTAVTGTYTSVAISAGDVSLVSFTVQGTPPFAPGSLQPALVYLHNPTDRSIQYWGYAYFGDPGDSSIPAEGGPVGNFILEAGPAATLDTQFYLTMPTQAGTYGIWLRFYEMDPRGYIRFIKRVNTGSSVTVGVEPPLGWPIETQLASIWPYFSQAGVYRGTPLLYYAYYKDLPISDLEELYSGETVYIEVVQACVLTYGKTQNLAAGWNTIVW